MTASGNPSRVAGWEHFHHDADIGVCGYGGSVAEAFEQAALARMRPLIRVKG
ncbi:archease [Chelativorans xinjiangense]|uniref:archease n=1 Tax=Chelativorans xinjiangense TaxID=2681485 RepID=UPI001359B190|nr:archease [Chelativorans xinjiangense]